MLKFNDGVQFDTTGPKRVEYRHDGAYLVGNGMLIPINDEEAKEWTKKLSKDKKDE